MQIPLRYAAAIRAHRNFCEAAIACNHYNGWSAEPARSFISHPEYSYIVLPIEWCFVLQHCIQALTFEHRDAFAGICRVAGLLWLHHTHGTTPVSHRTVKLFLHRSTDDWLDFFKYRMEIAQEYAQNAQDYAQCICTDTQKTLCDTVQIAQLWALLRLAGHPVDDQISFAFLDVQLSVQGSMAALGKLFDILTEPAFRVHPRFDALSAEECILEELQRNRESYVNLHATLPLGFSCQEETVLSKDLLEALPHKLVIVCLSNINTPDEDKPVVLSRFLAEYACSDNATSKKYASASLRAWMTSELGTSLRRDLTVTMCETANPATVMSCMTALVLYARSTTTNAVAGDEAAAAVVAAVAAVAASREEGYFARFLTSCARQSVSLRGNNHLATIAALEKPEPMAASLLRAASAPRSSSVPIVGLRWLGGIASVSMATDHRPADPVDQLADEYWQERLMGKTHRAVLEVLAERFRWCSELQTAVA